MFILNLANWLSNIWTEAFAAIFMAISFWMWGRWRGMMAWSRKKFMDRIVLSLNLSEQVEVNGEKKTSLKLRTIFEKDIREIFINDQAITIVRERAEQTKEGSPVVLLEKEDAWFILNYILNEISEKFAEGLIRRDMGLPVTAKRYIFCLTCEREGSSLRIQKLRVMLMEKEKFLQFPDQGELVLEHPTNHKVRVQTIRNMKNLYHKEPHHFMELEICI